MILRSNLPKVYALAGAAARVLDAGGGRHPLNLATHVLDLKPYDERDHYGALDPENPRRFTAETWIVHDACKAPWPFPDKFFDFSFCSHLLEDVRDPLAVCAELVRVSKAGYIETPSRAREIFAKARFFGVKSWLGRMPDVGFNHHRWFVEIDGAHVVFTAKDQRLLNDRRRYITRSDLGRKMREGESGAALFWEGGFTCEERLVDDSGADLTAYRAAALAQLRRAGGAGA
ncbi:MAG: methyltransferase domain-containing protein [Hyphomonadaceae bacterium]|nr:methyltransferase domain-containing protein [Hyphomonadaceae bacterium]